ncbi:GIY-YIG nuclease family protein [Pseudomonas sp. ENNP23]|uniref:GIY-YIG nuclease family protein n=1 Tax=Pseudomonas sp. ENNP23 TaxID=1535636 RepID=UPI0009F6454B|nr:GIY-YIG nuclease family protein [Pseudomonas sp. ENNP23]
MDISPEWKSELCQRHLYVLELKGGRYYVGQAKDPDRRIRKHFNGSGAEWTRIHPPLREISRTDLGLVDYRTGELAENTAVLELMQQHGFQNVRGGFFTNVSVEHTAKALISHGHGNILSTTSLKQLLSPERSVIKGCDAATEYSLFVLLLDGDRYFVGYSSNPDARIRRHFAGKAADWTALHKPLETVTTRSLGFITESEAAHAADRATVALMRKAGWRNVRGGSLWSLDAGDILKLLHSRGFKDIPPERPRQP